MPGFLETNYSLRANGVSIPVVDFSLTLQYESPQSWGATIDNRARNYGRSHAFYNPDAYTNPIEIRIGTSWTSPGLILDHCSPLTDQTTKIGGRCTLGEIDKDGQFIGDYRASTVSTIATAILAGTGLSISGLPTRDVAKFVATGNRLRLLQDLVGPTHTIRVNPGSSNITCFAVATPSSSGIVFDYSNIETISIQKTAENYNGATVERLEEYTGQVVLFDESRSEGTTIGTNSIDLYEPSRQFSITQLTAIRGRLHTITLYDAADDPITELPLLARSYTGTTSVHRISFIYEPGADASTWGEWVPGWSLSIVGFPESVTGVPPTGYSYTHPPGGGSRPFPEPFSSVSINSVAEAQDAAEAIVAQSVRQSEILQLTTTRLDPDLIPTPGTSIVVTDYLLEIDAEDFFVESVLLDPSQISITATKI